MAGREDWLSVARGSDEEIRERILTGYKEGKPFTPYVPTLSLPAGIDSVLDFGCGIGRNFPYLKRLARSVAGFDLPPMIERCRLTAVDSIDLLSDDWDRVRGLPFDLIVASLVLQHIEPVPMRSFLRDFARMAPWTYLLTRTQSDFGERILEVVAEMQLFADSDCVAVDHDSASHQLKVVGRFTFEAARRLEEDRHLELLLRSTHPR